MLNFKKWYISKKKYPASGALALGPDSASLDSVSCASCVSWEGLPYPIASGALEDSLIRQFFFLLNLWYCFGDM